MRSYSCSKELYRAYLLASCIRYSGLALSEVSPTPLSHDAVSRWLKNKRFSPKDVWSATRDLVDLDAPCLLLGDDSVLDKRHSRKIETVGYQYSGNAHDVIAGIGMVNMVWCPTQNREYLPVDFRVYDKDSDGKTKNSHCRDMLKVAKTRGFKPDAVVMDACYSSLDNLKCIRSLGWNWVCGLRKNRIVNRNQSLQNIEIPDEGANVHLRGYGWVHVFRFETSKRRTDYIATSIDNPTRDGIKTIMKARWKIEVFHRELKQTCAIERCQSRSGRAQRNHICMAVMAWVERFKRRLQDKLSFYGQQWGNVKPVTTCNNPKHPKNPHVITLTRNSCFSRTYRDKEGNYANSNRFSGTDLLKLSNIASQSYEAVQRHRATDRETQPPSKKQAPTQNYADQQRETAQQSHTRNKDVER